MGAEFSVGSGMWAPAVVVFDGDLEAISALWPVPGLFGFYFGGMGGWGTFPCRGALVTPEPVLEVLTPAACGRSSSP